MEIWDLYDRDGGLTKETAVRGSILPRDRYHLVVQLMIMNSRGQYLVSKRASTKPGSGMLEFVGGSAVKGETDLVAIKREAKEEIGLVFEDEELTLVGKYLYESESSCHVHIWQTSRDVDIDQLTFQEEEVASAEWMTLEQVVNRIKDKQFFSWKVMGQHLGVQLDKE